MALIKCPECGKEISDKAKMCIGCGFPLEEYLLENNKSDSEETQINIECKSEIPEAKVEHPVKTEQDEKFDLKLPNGDFIKLEKMMISLKIGEKEISDSIGSFILLHCDIHDATRMFTFSLIDKYKYFYSGVQSVTLDNENLFQAKQFKKFMQIHQIFANRSYEDELKRPLLDVTDVVNINKRQSKGKSVPKTYSPARSKKLIKLLEDYNKSHTFYPDYLVKDSYYACKSCGKMNVVGKKYCSYCGELNDTKEIKRDYMYNPQHHQKKEFHGIYRYVGKNKKEVYCPRCHSENCQYYTTERFVPGKTKTVYKANINPLKPFTLVNKKDKVITKDKTVTEKGIICNDCGYTFL